MIALLALALLSTGRLDSPSTDRAEKLAKAALVQHSSPRGAAPLIRLHAMLDEVDDLNLLAQPYAILLSRRSTDRITPTAPIRLRIRVAQTASPICQ